MTPIIEFLPFLFIYIALSQFMVVGVFGFVLFFIVLYGLWLLVNIFFSLSYIDDVF